MPFSLSVQSARGITFKLVVYFNALTYVGPISICMKKLADFYRTLLPGNLARTGYSFHAFLVHFTSYKHYPCMPVDGDPIMLS